MPASPIRRDHGVYYEADPIFVMGPDGQAAIIQGAQAIQAAGPLPEGVVASTLLSGIVAPVSAPAKLSSSEQHHSSYIHISSVISPSDTQSILSSVSRPVTSTPPITGAASPTPASHIASMSHTNQNNHGGDSKNSSLSPKSSSQTPSMQSSSKGTRSSQASPVSTATPTPTTTRGLEGDTSAMLDPSSLSSTSATITQTANAIVHSTTGSLMNQYMHSPVFPVIIVIGVLVIVAVSAAVVRYAFATRKSKKSQPLLEVEPSLRGSPPREMYEGQRMDDYMNVCFLPAAIVDRNPSFSSMMPFTLADSGGGGSEGLVTSASLAGYPGETLPLSTGSYQNLPISRSHFMASTSDAVMAHYSRRLSQASRISHRRFEQPSILAEAAATSMSAHGAAGYDEDMRSTRSYGGGMTGVWAASQIPTESAELAYSGQILYPTELAMASIITREHRESIPASRARTASSFGSQNDNAFRSLTDDDLMPERFDVRSSLISKSEDSDSEHDLGMWGSRDVGNIDRSMLKTWNMEESANGESRHAELPHTQEFKVNWLTSDQVTNS
ncbi:hypothetical protein HWV62_11584 [Athelia sp. TMB]|nr:hypothetical protein HWV62_11584 [Athelia sp. TMB]